MFHFLKKYTFLLVILVAFFSVAGCIKPEEYSPVPRIVSIQPSKTIIRNVTDTLYFLIEFEDSGADLGVIELDSQPGLFLYDARTDYIDSLLIPQIEDRGVTSSIKGQILARIPTQCCIPISGIPCTPNADYPLLDSLHFLVKLKDRSDNESEWVPAPLVLIDCYSF
ncbi:MAG: hypothetical protein H6554_03505 [Chitinophagales bacterium]|nr:hypothetical protein [Chitinophagales bacterium]